MCLGVFSGCLGSDQDTITDVSVCDLYNNHVPYIGDLVRVTGYCENTEGETRWQLLDVSGSEICRVAFDYDFGTETIPSGGTTITVIGVVQQDKVDIYEFELPILDDCYIST